MTGREVESCESSGADACTFLHLPRSADQPSYPPLLSGTDRPGFCKQVVPARSVRNDSVTADSGCSQGHGDFTSPESKKLWAAGPATMAWSSRAVKLAADTSVRISPRRAHCFISLWPPRQAGQSASGVYTVCDERVSASEPQMTELCHLGCTPESQQGCKGVGVASSGGRCSGELQAIEGDMY